MKLIIGLGNIGREYTNTRHNIGFTCLQAFTREKRIAFKNTTYYSYARYDDMLLILPKTYMNRSGQAYISAMKKFKGINEILVIMDDMDLELGEVRIKPNGGSGGHKGLSSILNADSTKDVARIRIGIGRDLNQKTSDFVLDRFSKEEQSILDPLLKKIVNWIDVFNQAGIKGLLDEYSKSEKKPIPSKTGGIIRPKEETND